MKSRDFIEEKTRKATEVKSLYQDVLAAVTLRTLHELFGADQCGHLQVITFNGYIETVDPATGRDAKPVLVAVQANRQAFEQLQLDRINELACLQGLRGRISPKPVEAVGVTPCITSASTPTS